MNWAGLGNSFQLFVLYTAVGFVVVAIAVQLAKRRWTKWAAGLGTFIVFWGLTLVDDIMGMREHKHLCEGEGGVKVYRQVKLPPEFYFSDGRPKFIDENGAPNPKVLAAQIKIEHKSLDSYASRYLKIDKLSHTILDAKTGELVAERVDFSRWPSPFIPSIMHGGAISCEESTEVQNASYLKLYRQTFPNLTATN